MGPYSRAESSVAPGWQESNALALSGLLSGTAEEDRAFAQVVLRFLPILNSCKFIILVLVAVSCQVYDNQGPVPFPPSFPLCLFDFHMPSAREAGEEVLR